MKKKTRILAYALCISGLMSFPAQAQTDVHVMDVGQGLSVLIESQGHYMLYDGGDSDKSSYVVSYLQQEDVSNLDYVVASHYDSDHLNGIVGALNAFPVSNVWGPNYTADTNIYRSFTSTLTNKGLSCIHPAVGQMIQLGDASIQVLAPSEISSDSNNNSIAIRIQDGNSSFLLTGDAEAQSEENMVASGLTLDSDVYVMGHHGSASSTSWTLLQEAVPEYAVLSCGTGNSYGHPHADSMEKLQVMGIQLFRTDKQGNIVASTDGNTITWNVNPCNDYTPGDPNEIPAQPQQSGASTANTQEAASVVYWTPGGKSYHNSRNCSTLKRSKVINNGSLNDAFSAGKYDPCNVCVK